MQEHLVVFQDRVVGDVLEPCRPQAQQQSRNRGGETKGEAGKQAAFPPAGGGGIDNREEPGKAFGRQVVPHQAGRHEGGGLAAQGTAAGPLLPEGRKTLGPKTGEFGLDRRSVFAPTHGAVVGEGHVAHIEHVLQQGERIHGQIPVDVLEQPTGLLHLWNEGQGNGWGKVRLASKHKQQTLATRRGVAAAAGSQRNRINLGLRLGNRCALALAVKAPAVIRALQIAPVVQPPLAQGNQPVRADVGKGPPLPGRAVPPENQILIQQREGRGPALVQVGQVGHRIPVLTPGHGSWGRSLGLAARVGTRACSIGVDIAGVEIATDSSGTTDQGGS